MAPNQIAVCAFSQLPPLLYSFQKACLNHKSLMYLGLFSAECLIDRGSIEFRMLLENQCFLGALGKWYQWLDLNQFSYLMHCDLFLQLNYQTTHVSFYVLQSLWEDGSWSVLGEKIFHNSYLHSDKLHNYSGEMHSRFSVWGNFKHFPSSCYVSLASFYLTYAMRKHACVVFLCCRLVRAPDYSRLCWVISEKLEHEL